MRIMQPKKIVIEVEMRDGKLRTLECESVTRSKLEAMMQAGERVSKSNRASDIANILYEQVAIIFGGHKEDYFDIDDVRVVKQIIAFVNEQIQNPI